MANKLPFLHIQGQVLWRACVDQEQVPEGDTL